MDEKRRNLWRFVIGTAILVVFSFPTLIAAQEDTLPVLEESLDDAENATRPPLTGNPQIDYIHDPNLPHELHGYDLSDYPFYKRVPDPKTINFTCEGRHDGFYASVPHKCQVYHNCLFEKRYDFVCANFTVFDQKNFICHYVSEVDCVNSEKYYFRNDELYETTTTTTQAPIIIYRPQPQERRKQQSGRLTPITPKRKFSRRPPLRQRRPAQDYYYDSPADQVAPATKSQVLEQPSVNEYADYDEYYDYYGDDYYYYDEPTTTTTTQRPRRKRPLRRRRPQNDPGNNGGFFNVRNRQKPRISLPVPINAKEPGAPIRKQKKPLIKRTTTTTTTAAPEINNDFNNDYYDYYEYDNAAFQEASSSAPITTTTTSTTTTTEKIPDLRPQSTQTNGRRAQFRRRRPNKQTPSDFVSTAPQIDPEPPRRPVGTRRDRLRSNIQNRNAQIRSNRRINDNKSQSIQGTEGVLEEKDTLNEVTPRLSSSGLKRNEETFPEIVVEEPPLAPGISLSAIDASSSNLPEQQTEGRRRRIGRPQEQPIIRDRRPLRRVRARVVDTGV